MAQGPTPDPSSNQPILARSALLEGNCFWNRAANLGRKRAGASVWLRPPLAAEPWSGDWSLVTLVRSTLGPIPPSGDRLEDPVKAWKKDGKRVAYWSDWTSQITTANRPYPILCIYECPFCIILESASGRAEGEKNTRKPITTLQRTRPPSNPRQMRQSTERLRTDWSQSSGRLSA